jgi:hypothetical protein
MVTMGRGDGVERCERSSSVVVHLLILAKEVDCPTATTVPEHLLPYRAPGSISISGFEREGPRRRNDISYHLNHHHKAVGTNVWRGG